IRLGRTILATADLPGNEQKSVRPNRRGIPVALIERLAPLGKNHITPSHDLPPSWTVGGPCLSSRDCRSLRRLDKLASPPITVCRCQTILARSFDGQVRRDAGLRPRGGDRQLH